MLGWRYGELFLGVTFLVTERNCHQLFHPKTVLEAVKKTDTLEFNSSLLPVSNLLVAVERHSRWCSAASAGCFIR